ncbi:hypothetical protein [Mycobacterium marinum]|uniref:hypothetical protein n=1 Tax=Mycobacterium marinum TaxID=1781 RepID=UPI0035622676
MNSLSQTGHPGEKILRNPGAATDTPPNDADVPMHPAAGGIGASGDPRRIVRTRSLTSTSLDASERSQLANQLYDIFSNTVRGDTYAQFEAHVFGGDEVRLGLFYNANDELAGFVFVGIDRIELGASTQAVFYAGVFFRPGHHGGALATRFLLRQALRFKLRQPRTPLAYCPRSSSPAAYLMAPSTFPRAYPNRRYPTPVHIQELARTFSARRGYVAVGENPWVVRSAATPVEASRMSRLMHDPDVQFYLTLNPRFAQGEALVTCVPLDLANIAGGLLRLLRKRLADSARL